MDFSGFHRRENLGEKNSNPISARHVINIKYKIVNTLSSFSALRQRITIADRTLALKTGDLQHTSTSTESALI